MNLSCSSSSTNLINSSSAPTVTVPALPSTLATVHFNPQDFINIFLEPYTAHSPNSAAPIDAEAQTLQLFPLESGGDRGRHEEESSDNDEEEEEEPRVSSFNNIATPCQFFEFLPLKNWKKKRKKKWVCQFLIDLCNGMIWVLLFANGKTGIVCYIMMNGGILDVLKSKYNVALWICRMLKFGQINNSAIDSSRPDLYIYIERESPNENTKFRIVWDWN